MLRLAALVCLLSGPALAQDGPTIFAAASLKTALDEIGAEWSAQTGRDVAISYGGSSALARQILQGAPADVFISANVEWMDAVEGSIEGDSRRDLLGNRLVLIAPAGGDAAPVNLVPGVDLAGLLGDEGRMAMAQVDAVPAGLYGRAALDWLGAWDAVAPRVAHADNVRGALAFVALGEAPLGIVYATDAVAEPRVTVLGTFPAESHAPIVYPAGALSDDAQALDFLDYLSGDAAASVFGANGFTVLPRE
ncbi:putative molybdate-binding periplasmic ABC transporter protein [Oceaniovalibus guishaninsula JLT2003]|uniref:Putative molybdate-binding periplasmic ABC transporter protein n=1 Tax=Oceaniovalibus guishaninsula JLT2003 TaxID=1231392 RepID=K2GLE6_9RHOB|nr:molybdate ABC transporter substrate-binding protein [Oceaniovalibus guishaninsula]EKE43566.1 putative molybdate-binding periplasmic ABC transporter protein [Oceaniovalibus guishaninsula JLT2003]